MFKSSRILLALSVIFLTGSASSASADASNVEVKIIAFNDLHGHLEAPRLSLFVPAANSVGTYVPAGGAAYLASAIKSLKQANPNHAVVSAGDMIGASPLVSALFLDEPTIEAVNAFGIDFNAVGNHEFDKGWRELLRMQNGGCAKFTQREPCALNKQFPGANFGFLAANTFKADGQTLFPATGIKSFGSGTQQVKIGFIGLTLKNTPHIVTPAGVAGLSFADEAGTANALVPQLKAQGADAIVVVIHEGGVTNGSSESSCPSLTGAIVPILERLAPAIDVVVSGHTHRSYICDYGKRNPAKPFLLTSAGQYGTVITDINLTIDPRTHKVVSKSADNVIVQGESFVNNAGVTIKPSADYPRFGKDRDVDAIVTRYADAAAALTNRMVGRLTISVSRRSAISGESPLGNLIADAQLAATQSAEHGGAQIALMNPGGIRADLHVPNRGGEITYGQIFSVQPFGNNLVVKSFSGTQLHRVLEQQFKRQSNTDDGPRILFPSAGFTYSYDLQKPAGSRVSAMRLHGVPIVDKAIYRVTINSYLANGGDQFSLFNKGEHISGGAIDVDALEAYLRSHSPMTPPATNRITRID
ncbi:bifunctional metallophosphatase/5'-nucleotidase [Herminiimonas fonticola]|uniref:5'-nucleotidase n=1 Tax=Herminiimonas fonticola TaxID=303380 RepID=A0A4R6G8Z5_9BURK|nr:bifunctional metallophosphatase/5'-nucleotidase [Herminiimonas fonticola]RBA24304.1 5'-nucleotidase/2'3'-cyclic phosphodiesterase and related esterase [Herminiimonas fonticola]TDN90305.1 5'-nucleotidase [Herminiimonas fonticola]